ncbi:MAG: response regulator transcription factor [Candidatus Gracilibacteria bacterium]|nr:response regulator transcription factor [Candidatus Gracilibacteria bacterium]
MKILLIEDNIQISSNIVRFLSLKNISCESSIDGEDGLYKALTKYYDIIILDINLPKISGLEILKKIREKQKEVPVIMLTSNSTKEDIVIGLNYGADDYLTKPFDFDELLARLNSLNRRNLKIKSNIINIGDFIIDLEKFSVSKNGEIIKLSSQEFNLLKYFVQNKNKVISRKELYEKVWGEFDGDIMFSKTVDVYIGYLRKKIDNNLIKTIKGVGYTISD